ncbi:MAG: hypothetical protein A4S09_11010 [Proteobacteria bacterium SG_bin7]|nr:MAG: hypothetical protein A4S09_11010 [Proteobacteria bacterium SG_bin7]
MSLVLVLLVGLLSVQAADTYEGSSFNEVLSILGNDQNVVKSEKEKSELAVYKSGNLPVYPVNSQTVFGPGADLIKDAKRTTEQKYDYYDYLPKKVHPNGVCVTGEWKITDPSPYTGYFATEARGLFIGRISVTMDRVLNDENRGFGFAGKIFPTLNPNEKVKTANFFTADVLLGTSTRRFFDTRVTNQPDSGFDLSLLALGFKIAQTFKKADQDPSFRPVSTIAKLGENQNFRSPRWIRISPNSNIKKNNQKDFRNEVLQAATDNDEIIFNIEVSEVTGDRNASQWQRLGEIKTHKALVGYGCDRRLHFAHPKLAD